VHRDTTPSLAGAGLHGGSVAVNARHGADHEAAIIELEALLPEMARVLAPDHLDTLTTRHNLAHWPDKASNTSGAARDAGSSDS
jgi:hypothetical protein